MQLIIGGFHRSGTSMLTQLLHRAGLFVGDDLLGALPSNPYGHFEDREFLQLHRSILERHGTDWQWDTAFPFYIGPDHWRAMNTLARRRNLNHRLWGFKDPRACLFLGAWKYVLPDAKFVLVYRDPGECVRSLESRQAGDYLKQSGNSEDHLRFFGEPDHGLRLWNAHNQAMVWFAQAHPNDCVVVPFTSITAGFPIVARLNQRFGLGLDEVTVGEVFDPEVSHSRATPQPVHSAHVAESVQRTWTQLESLTETDARWGAN